MSEQETTNRASYLHDATAQPQRPSDPYAGIGKSTLTQHLVNPARPVRPSGLVQRARSDVAPTAADVTSRAAEGVAGTGGPVPHREKMEAAFGTSFAGVTAHTGREASEACDSIGAHAYATGSQVAFTTPDPDPSLVAHELTHVVQQRAGVHAKSDDEPTSDHEREADDVGARVARGESVVDVTGKYAGAAAPVGSGPVVQRKKIATLADVPAEPADGATIEQLVERITALIVGGQQSIRFPGPGHRLDGGPDEPPQPNPALTSPEVHRLLVDLMRQLANETRGSTEAWPLDDYPSRDIPDLLAAANQLLATRNQRLAPAPDEDPVPEAPSFPGEGHALGGSLSLEEARRNLPGPDRPREPSRASAPNKALALPVGAKDPRKPQQAPASRSGGGPQGGMPGSGSGLRGGQPGSSTVTMQVEHGPTALLPTGGSPQPDVTSSQPTISDGKQEAPDAPSVPASTGPSSSEAAQRAAREAYRRHIRTNGWASDAELALLAASAGVTVVIHHCDEQGDETYQITVGAGPTVIHLRHMNNHYDLIENGRIVRVDADGNCGWVAFYRGVTGILPQPGEIDDLREHAADHLEDEQVDNIVAAQDHGDVDMGRMRGSEGSNLDALALLQAMLDELLEADEEAPSETSSTTSENEPKSGEQVESDEAEAEVVKTGVEDGASAFLLSKDALIEASIDALLASDPNALGKDSEEEEDDASAEVSKPKPSDPPDDGGPPDDPGRGHGGGPPDRGPPDRGGHPSGGSAPRALDPSQIEYEKTGSGFGDAVLKLVDKGTGTSGYVGTEGANNFGGKDKVFGPEVHDWQGSKGDAVTSGVSDALSAVGGTIAFARGLDELKKAVATLKDSNKSVEERGKAAMDVGSAATGLVQNYCVLEGGVMTALEGSETIKDKSSFGFTAEGGNAISTDWKLAGDAAGILTDVMGVIASALEAIHDYEKLIKGTKAEAVGRVSLTIAKGLGQLARTAKTLGQFVGQIQGHGQIAKDFGGSAFKAYGGQFVPAVGAGLAAANIGRQSYNIHKFRKRRHALKRMLQGQQLTAAQAEALNFIREVLKKRITRAGIDIGISSVDFLSGILQVATPIGTATGTAISATTASVRLGIVATRTIKQKLRDRKARKRAESGKTESYEDWAARQKAKGVKGKLDALVTPNWDKSSAKKQQAYIRHAMTLFELDSDALYRTIGLTKQKVDGMKDAKERVEAIIKALQKR